MADIVKQRGDTASNWTSTNPVLLDRQLGFETDTGLCKLGDGITAWNALGYLYDSSGSSIPISYLDTDGTLAANSDTKVATQKATKTYADARETAAKAYADALVVGLWDDRGSYDASGNTYPASGGSGSAGAILKGDIWTISVAGTLGGTAVAAGDTVRALVDTPGQTASNWALGENNIGYVPARESRNINTGASLSGGGDLSADRTLSVNLGNENAWTAQQYFAQQSLTDAANIDWNLSTQQTATVTLGGNRTLNAPSNIKAGSIYVLRVKQDGTGSRTLTWNSAYKFPSGIDPTLTSAANAIDLFMFYAPDTASLELLTGSFDVK